MERINFVESHVDLHYAHLAITTILDNRLVQQQRGELRQAVNARILIEFIHQVRADEAELIRRKRIKESILRLTVNTRKEQIFEDALRDLRRKLELFAWELEMGVFAASRKSSVVSSIESGQESQTSLDGVHSDFELIPTIFEAAFDRSIKGALESIERHREQGKTTHYKLGAGLFRLWKESHA